MAKLAATAAKSVITFVDARLSSNLRLRLGRKLHDCELRFDAGPEIKIGRQLGFVSVADDITDGRLRSSKLIAAILAIGQDVW